ncbi:MAG: hypothetical protein KBS70_00870 [Bacteroidales bacterium]|nr:hypothetical protein [Candidatus Colicola equi]
MNCRFIYILLITCCAGTTFARPVVVRDSARSTEPVVITESFVSAQSGMGYGDKSYTGAITWQLKNGKVDKIYSMFGSDNTCAILEGTDKFIVQEASSLTSEKIQGLREVRCKMKRSVSAVSMAIYISADQTKWMDITNKYSIALTWDKGTMTCSKSEMNELYIPTSASPTYTFSIALPRDTDVYVRWIMYNGNGKYAFIDDVELVTHPWVYSQHEEEIPDYTRSTDADHQIGIVCWPQAVHKDDYAGATFYEVAYRVGTADQPTDFVVSEVEDLEAGIPYIYIASGSAITADGNGESVTTAQHRNGLYGALTKIENSEMLGNKWVLFQNELWQIAPTSTASIKANSGYIDMTEVPEENTFTPVSGRQYRSLSGRGIVTAERKIMASMNRNKVLLDGELVIIKDGQRYDILGRNRR